MRLIRNGLSFLLRRGLVETFKTVLYWFSRRFKRIPIDNSAKKSLQVVLAYLNIHQPGEALVSALIHKSGREKTSRILADAVELEKLLSKEGSPSSLVDASKLPVNSTSTLRRRILFITAEFPSPHHGGGNRVLNFIKTLAPDNDIYLCTTYLPEEHEKYLPMVESYCLAVLKLPYWRFEGNQEIIRKWIGERRMDIVHYEWPRSMENYDARFGAIQIFTYMEAVSLRLIMDMEKIAPLSPDWLEKLEQLIYALRLELVVASAVEARVAVTTKDAEFFKNLYPFQEYAILNHGLDVEEFSLPEVGSEPNTLTFVGNYLHYPNSEAMDYFFDQIWEDIRREIPDVRIYLVGTNPTDRMLEMADGKSVIVTGTVEDVRPYIQKATVCIAPLISGAGLRGKVIEYAALKRPFVATSIATTDLAFEDGVDYFCADTAIEFSTKVVSLLRDTDLAAGMAAHAYEVTRQHYDNRRLTDFLLSLYEYLEKKRS